ncbi:hypothetical protein VC83_04810 [Pseudogymnoascus destructans]|uniref:Uncharacterized protein n=2 Tax=Pseudogymnoascus destructans TaxID=655981 RepID=L8GBC7_PSED2|nr:uncharacterized protein VC83_04810 [Pseudogymnoascus destructans]ELR10515.1 hypothetical protein GMDG_04793 [Pseudogymnoascus destructans 20631-21]OAF57258.1 hypothetical protein VC83_04810 [Pseudogymnoascus destructans]
MPRILDQPDPNLPLSIIYNYFFERYNKELKAELTALTEAYEKRGGEIQTLREKVEETLPAQLLQQVDSRMKAIAEQFTAEMDMLKEEIRASLATQTQDRSRLLKECDEKQKVENQKLRDELQAMKRKCDEMSERVEALKKATQDMEPVGDITRARKRSRPTLTAQKSTLTLGNEAALSTITDVPIAQVDKEAPQPKAHQQVAEPETPAPDMDSSITMIAATPTASVPVPDIPRFHNGHIRQGSLSLDDYAAAFAHHVSSIRTADQSVDKPGPAERESVGKFVRGMKKLSERIRLVEDLGKKGLASTDQQTRSVELFCGWQSVKEALEGW